MDKPIKKIHRLRLKHTEKESLIQNSAAAFLDNPTIGIWGAIEKGINTLPEGRRPTLSKAKTWIWLVPSVQAAVGPIKRQQDREPEPPDLTIVSSEALIQELADRFISTAVERMQDSIRKSLRQEISSLLPDLRMKPTTSKKKIAIIGLLKRQEQLIKREFGNEFDLRFYKPNKIGSSSTIVDMCKQADHVVVMLGFISHSNEDSIRRVAKSYIRVPGGMTNLRDKLTELYVGENK